MADVGWITGHTYVFLSVVDLCRPKHDGVILDISYTVHLQMVSPRLSLSRHLYTRRLQGTGKPSTSTRLLSSTPHRPLSVFSAAWVTITSRATTYRACVCSGASASPSTRRRGTGITSTWGRASAPSSTRSGRRRPARSSSHPSRALLRRSPAQRRCRSSASRRRSWTRSRARNW